MSERQMRQRVVRALRVLDAVSVENSAHAGTPDINFTEGWIELKDIDKWPKYPDTPLRVHHFTPQQRVWIRRRAKRGGNVWVLLRVAHDWLLFDGVVAAIHLGHRTRAELTALATRIWHKNLNEAELRRLVQRKGEDSDDDIGVDWRLDDSD